MPTPPPTLAPILYGSWCNPGRGLAREAPKPVSDPFGWGLLTAERSLQAFPREVLKADRILQACKPREAYKEIAANRVAQCRNVVRVEMDRSRPRGFSGRIDRVAECDRSRGPFTIEHVLEGAHLVRPDVVRVGAKIELKHEQKVNRDLYGL
jgi:ribosomal protein S21